MSQREYGRGRSRGSSFDFKAPYNRVLHGESEHRNPSYSHGSLDLRQKLQDSRAQRNEYKWERSPAGSESQRQYSDNSRSYDYYQNRQALDPRQSDADMGMTKNYDRYAGPVRTDRSEASRTSYSSHSSDGAKHKHHSSMSSYHIGPTKDIVHNSRSETRQDHMKKKDLSRKSNQSSGSSVRDTVSGRKPGIRASSSTAVEPKAQDDDILYILADDNRFDEESERLFGPGAVSSTSILDNTCSKEIKCLVKDYKTNVDEPLQVDAEPTGSFVGDISSANRGSSTNNKRSISKDHHSTSNKDYDRSGGSGDHRRKSSRSDSLSRLRTKQEGHVSSRDKLQDKTKDKYHAPRSNRTSRPDTNFRKCESIPKRPGMEDGAIANMGSRIYDNQSDFQIKSRGTDVQYNNNIGIHTHTDNVNRPRESDRMPESSFYKESSQLKGPPLSPKRQPYRKGYVSKKIADKYFTKPRTIDQAMKGKGKEFGFRKGKEFGYRQPITDTFRAQGTSNKCLYITDGKKHDRDNNANSLDEVYKKGRYQLKSHGNSSGLQTRKDNTAKSVGLRQYDRVKKKYLKGGFTNRSRIRNNNSRFVQNKNKSENEYENVSDTKSDHENDAHIPNIVDDSFPQISHHFVAPDQNQQIIFLPTPEFQTANTQTIDQFGNVIVNPEVLAQNVVNQTMSLQLDNSAVPPPPPGTEYVFIPFVNPGPALLDTVPADQGIPPITPTGTIFCTNEQAASNVVSSGPVLRTKYDKLRKLASSQQQRHKRRQQLLIKKKKQFEKKFSDGIIKKVIEKRKLKGTGNLETASKNPRAHADTNTVELKGKNQPYPKFKDRKYDDISDLEDVSDDENKYEKVSDLEDVSDDDDNNDDKQRFGHVRKKNFIRKSVRPRSTIKREHDSTDTKLSNPEKRILKIKRTIKQEVADLRKVVESPNSLSPVKRRRINATLHDKTRHVPVHSTTDASTFSRQANEPSENRNLVYEKRPMSPLHITVKNDHYTEHEESKIKEHDRNISEVKYAHKHDHDESVNIYREQDYSNDKVSQRYTPGHEQRRDEWSYQDRKEVSSSYDRVKIEKGQGRELKKDHQHFITVKNEHYAEHEESRIKEHESNNRERQYAHRHDHDDGVNIYREQDDNNDRLSQRYTRGHEQRRGEWSCHDSKEVSRSYDKDNIEKGHHRELNKDHQNVVTVKNDHYAEHEESRIKEHDSNNRERKYSHRHDHDEGVNIYREQDYNNDKPSQRYTRDHEQRTGNWSCHDSKEISRSYDRDKDEKEQHNELNKDHQNVDIRKQTRASFNEMGTSKMKATVNYDDENYSGDEYQGNTRRHNSLESKYNKGRSRRSDREPLNSRSTQLEHDEHCKDNVSQMTSYTNDRDQYDTDREKSVPQYDDKIDRDRNKYRDHLEHKNDSMNKTIDREFQNDHERGKLSHPPRKSVISHDMDKEKTTSSSKIVYSDPTQLSNTTLQEHSNRKPAYNLNPKEDRQFDSFQIQKSSNDRETSHFNAVNVPALLTAVSQNHSEKSQNVFDPSLPPSLSERTSLTPNRKNAPDMSLPPPPMPSANLLAQPRFVIQQQSVTNQLLSNAADQPQRNDLLSSQQFPNSPMMQLQQQVLAQQGLQSQLQNQQQLIMASINQQQLGQQQVFVNPQQQQSNVFGQSQLPGQNTGMQQLIVQQANKQQTFQQIQQPQLIQQTQLPNTQQIQNQQNFQQMQNQPNFQQLQNQQNLQQMQIQHFQQIQTGPSNNVTKQPPATQRQLTVNQQQQQQPANQQQFQQVQAMLRAKFPTQQQHVDLQSKVVGTLTATKAGGNVGSGVSGIVQQRMLNSSQISRVKPSLLPLPLGIRPNNNSVKAVTGGALLQLPGGRVQYASNSSSAGQSGITVSQSNTMSRAPVMYDSKPSTNAGKMPDKESIEDPGNMTCNRCDLHFVSVSLFKRHVRWHNFYNRNIKDLRCDDCQQAFPTTSMLRDHNTERHSGNAYSCGSCDAIFTALYALFRHTKSTGHHTRVKAHYLCSECKSSFPTHDALVEHRKSRHPEKKVYDARPYN